ncbi:MAG: sulfur carrier protein ThiS, partial [Methylococcales bacterium]|nr:sulfur carrier protein ThiS [Methylococcales bacterium]
MNIFINGDRRDYGENTTVTDIVTDLGFANKRIAVELNKEILPFNDYPQKRLQENDKLEIVHAIGGGSDDSFSIGSRSFKSRLLVGTGKYKNLDETRLA